MKLLLKIYHICSIIFIDITLIDRKVSMEINIKNYGKEVQDLYREVRLLSEYDVVIDYNESKVEHFQAALQSRLSDGRFVIYVKESNTPDYIVIHELFHIYFILKGYPQNFYMTHIMDGIEWQVGSELHNAILHKLIIDEQIRRNMSLDNENRVMREVIEKEEAYEGEDVCRLVSEIALGVNVYFQGSKKERLFDLKEKYPRTFPTQKEIIDIVEAKEEWTPFEVSKAVTKIYKKIDEFCDRFQKKRMNLHKKMMIEAVWTKRQLDLNVKQVLDFEQVIYGSEKCLTLCRKSNGQNVMYLLHDTEQDIENMSVRELYQHLDFIPLTK